MSADGFFWAGMAGGRQDQIDRLHRDIDTWEAHVEKLNRIIADLQDENAELRESRLLWLDTACQGYGEARLIARSFRKVHGTSATEYLGGPDEADRLIAKAKEEEYRSGVGTNFDWKF